MRVVTNQGLAAAASITLIEMTNLQEDYTMKRLTAAILALVITLSLCACGATGNTKYRSGIGREQAQKD